MPRLVDREKRIAQVCPTLRGPPPGACEPEPVEASKKRLRIEITKPWTPPPVTSGKYFGTSNLSATLLKLECEFWTTVFRHFFAIAPGQKTITTYKPPIPSPTIRRRLLLHHMGIIKQSDIINTLRTLDTKRARYIFLDIITTRYIHEHDTKYTRTLHEDCTLLDTKYNPINTAQQWTTGETLCYSCPSESEDRTGEVGPPSAVPPHVLPLRGAYSPSAQRGRKTRWPQKRPQ